MIRHENRGEFDAHSLLLAGLVLDRGQLTAAQWLGLETLVEQGVAQRETNDGVPAWRPVPSPL